MLWPNRSSSEYLIPEKNGFHIGNMLVAIYDGARGRLFRKTPQSCTYNVLKVVFWYESGEILTLNIRLGRGRTRCNKETSCETLIRHRKWCSLVYNQQRLSKQHWLFQFPPPRPPSSFSSSGGHISSFYYQHKMLDAMSSLQTTGLHFHEKIQFYRKTHSEATITVTTPERTERRLLVSSKPRS